MAEILFSICIFLLCILNGSMILKLSKAYNETCKNINNKFEELENQIATIKKHLDNN